MYMGIFDLLIMCVVGLPVIAMLVFLFVKSGKVGRWCIVGAIFLLPVLFIMTFAPRTVRVAEGPVVNIQQVSEGNPLNIESAPIWTEGIEDQFEADVYPSKQSAVRALGLRTKGQADVNLNTVDIETHPVSWSGESESKLNSGRVEATVAGNNKQTTISANFVEKPWVENFADFVNRNPKDKWILARSQQSCTSQAEAEQQAINNACDKLACLLNQMHKQRFAVGGGFTVTDADIRNNSFLADRFAQSFAGTAGRIWRQAILINASQDKLTELAKQKMLARQSWRTRWIRELLSIVGITILICVVYLFLNAATRGYYTWSLRIAAVVLVLAGILLIFTLS